MLNFNNQKYSIPAWLIEEIKKMQHDKRIDNRHQLYIEKIEFDIERKKKEQDNSNIIISFM